MVISYCSRFF